MAIQTIGVIGAGTMGNGISQACAAAGLRVVMLDVNEVALQKGLATISGSLDRLVRKEKLTEGQKADTMGRVTATTRYADLRDVDFVIEAATENEALKIKILKEVEAAVRSDVILATNTSSISITAWRQRQRTLLNSSGRTFLIRCR